MAVHKCDAIFTGNITVFKVTGVVSLLRVGIYHRRVPDPAAVTASQWPSDERQCLCMIFDPLIGIRNCNINLSDKLLSLLLHDSLLLFVMSSIANPTFSSSVVVAVVVLLVCLPLFFSTPAPAAITAVDDISFAIAAALSLV